MWLVGLFSLSLLMSQTAMNIFATLLIFKILWMGYRWHQQRSPHRIWNSTEVDWLFAVWFLIVVVGFAVQGFPGNYWYQKLSEFGWIFVFYSLITAFRQLEPDQAWVKFMAAAFFLCSLWAVIVWFLGFDPMRPGEPLQTLGDWGHRTGGFLFQPIVFAHLYQMPLAILLGLFLTMMRWREKGVWLVGLACAMGTVAIFLSFTRGVWISLTVATFVMLFLYSRRIAALAVVLGCVLFAGAYKFVPAVHERVNYGLHGGDAERVWIWKANLEMFKDHPLLGIGYGENVFALDEYYKKMGAPTDVTPLREIHAHNQYIQMLSGTGVLGFLAYLGLMFYFLSLSYRVWKVIGSREVFYQGLSLGLIGAQVGFLVGGLTEANFEHSKMRYTVAFVWALVVWLAYRFNILRESIR